MGSRPARRWTGHNLIDRTPAAAPPGGTCGQRWHEHRLTLADIEQGARMDEGTTAARHDRRNKGIGVGVALLALLGACCCGALTWEALRQFAAGVTA